jgi:hypothetical protein
MSIIFRVIIVLLSCFGAYMFFGQLFPRTHDFAFPLMGMGVTYLALIAFGTGCIAAKVTA